MAYFDVNYRQGDDPPYERVLHRLRTGTIMDEDKDTVNT